jgi:hypothetical protein
MSEEMKKTEVSLKGEKLAIAMPNHSGLVPMWTVVGLIELAGVLGLHKIPFLFLNNYQHSLVDQARNDLAHQFLESDATKIIWIDSDIAFHADDVIRLLAFSKLYPMVGGLYPIKGLPDGQEKYFFDLPNGKATITEHGLFQAQGTGFGFHIADRAVYEDMKKHTRTYNKRGETRYDFFRVGRKMQNGELTPFGEDFYFFRKAAKHGWHLVIDPSIKIGHVGIKVWRGDPRKMFGFPTED